MHNTGSFTGAGIRNFQPTVNRRYFLDSHVVKPGELTMYSFDEWGHQIIERITREGKNFEVKKGIYQFRGFVLEGEGEGVSEGEDEGGVQSWSYYKSSRGRDSDSDHTSHTTSHTTSHYQSHLADLEIIQYNEDDLKNWSGEKVKVWDAQWGDAFVVDMNERKCTCGLFQDLGFPCGHALYILHTLEKYDEVMSYVSEGYKQQHILETIGDLDTNDMDSVINLKKQDKQRVEKKIDSYRDMNIQYWEMATILAHRIESTGERERNLLLGLPPSKHFKSTHLTQVQTTLNENRRKR